MSGPPLLCRWCGIAFNRPHRRGPRPEYCTAGHRRAAYRQRLFEDAIAAEDAAERRRWQRRRPG